MTAEEAKNQLIKFVHLMTTLEPVFLNVCVDALDKQIPKKPNNIGRFDSFGMRYCKCPRCGGGINSDQRWCPNCGQKIDWSDNE